MWFWPITLKINNIFIFSEPLIEFDFKQLFVLSLLVIAILFFENQLYMIEPFVASPAPLHFVFERHNCLAQLELSAEVYFEVLSWFD